LSEHQHIEKSERHCADVVRSTYSGGNRSELIISRAWAMPSMHTFQIDPIAQLIKKYVGCGKGWVDPFAGETSPAEWTNDLNPNKPAKFHKHAIQFAEELDGEYEGALYDPPYSVRQLKECYEGIGQAMSQEDTQGAVYTRVKDALSRKVRMGGLVICCGWNTIGFGKKRGFQLLEILIVCHGRLHNDTLVTVERKVHHQERLLL